MLGGMCPKSLSRLVVKSCGHANSQGQQPEGREVSVLPWQSPRWAVLPYSVSCSNPPALWLWEANKSSVNSLHRDPRDNQDRAENTDWLVTGSREHTLTTQHTCQRDRMLVHLGRLGERNSLSPESVVLRVAVPKSCFPFKVLDFLFFKSFPILEKEMKETKGSASGNSIFFLSGVVATLREDS